MGICNLIRCILSSANLDFPMGVNVQFGMLRTQEQTLNEHTKIIGRFSVIEFL